MFGEQLTLFDEDQADPFEHLASYLKFVEEEEKSEERENEAWWEMIFIRAETFNGD